LSFHSNLQKFFHVAGRNSRLLPDCLLAEGVLKTLRLQQMNPGVLGALVQQGDGQAIINITTVNKDTSIKKNTD